MMRTPTLQEAKFLAVFDFPHRVFLRPLALKRHSGEDLQARERLTEIRRWCIMQFGRGATGAYANPPEAYTHGQFLDPKIARCTYDPEAAWFARMYDYRFRDVRHAVLFKLYAY
jgi:hypothetical protein